MKLSLEGRGSPDLSPGRSSGSSRPLRVLHVPEGHGYVEHVRARPGSDAPTRRYPRFDWREDPRWVSRLAREVDVVHVHFGFDQCSPEHLHQLLDAFGAAGVPVVWTAHDLTNPHLVDQASHEAQLSLLAERVAAVLTLTPGAAREVARRWGRHALVVGHPHLAPLQVLGRVRPAPQGPPVLGLPLGTFRPATDPAVVRAVLRLLPSLPDVTLRVWLREEVMSPGFPRMDADLADLLTLLRRAERAGRADLRVGGRLDEDTLWDGLGELSALVLPYRWGSHSGWVESCYDVGTPVVAPDLGHWGEQQRVHAFRSDGSGPDPRSLAAAVGAALAEGPRTASVVQSRLRERADAVRVHDLVHRLVAEGGRL